jgi:hypothetical protein
VQSQRSGRADSRARISGFKGQDKWVRDLEDRKGNLDEKLKWMEEYQQKIGV